MERKLASIKQVKELKPIEGKDRIELAIVDGWSVIVQKEEYQPGDKTVFVEIDSILPDKPEFEFLKKRGLRIKTMKMSGVLSQGICFSLSILPKGEYKLEQDVTDIIGIKKYEKYTNDDTSEQPKNRNPLMKFLLRFRVFRQLFGNYRERSGFPSFIAKTDETRLQNIPHVLENKNIKYVVREKIDGQSVTFFLKRKRLFGITIGFDFGVCSRNMRLYKDTDNQYWKVAKMYEIEDVLKHIIGLYDWVSIQGEVIAPNVQGNKYRIGYPDLHIFNLIYPSGKASCEIAVESMKRFGLKWCPLVEKDFALKDTVDEMLEYSNGWSKVNPEVMREGIVLRNYEHNISFKVVSPEFLIKNDE